MAKCDNCNGKLFTIAVWVAVSGVNYDSWYLFLGVGIRNINFADWNFTKLFKNFELLYLILNTAVYIMYIMESFNNEIQIVFLKT
jgi:hypothetical protein